MTTNGMTGEPVPPDGLEHIEALQRWIQEHPNDSEVHIRLRQLAGDSLIHGAR